MTHQDFMPLWKEEEKCFEKEIIGVDTKTKKEVSWPRDKPISQVYYEKWLEEVVNPDTKEYYPSKDRDGMPIKGKSAKHVVRTIVRLRRNDGSEYLYSHGRLVGYNLYGDIVTENCQEPEVWNRTIFRHERIFDTKTKKNEMRSRGPTGTEIVYTMPFNEENLKQLFNKRESDDSISFVVKDEATSKVVQVRKEPHVQDTLKLFLKPFDYLFNSDYITAQEKAELREFAEAQGLIPKQTNVQHRTSKPPSHTAYL